MKKFPAFIFCLFLLLFLAGPAAAHKVRIFAYSESGKIVGETEFSGGRTPKNAEIVVMNQADGKVLATCRTDENGNFSLKIPEAARKGHLNLKLVVKDGEGHQGEWLLNAEDYLNDSADDEVVPDETLADRQPATASPSPSAAAAGHPATTGNMTITPEALKKIVEQAVDRKIAPLKRILLENQDKGPTIQDIMGGIGYLIGLAGIAAYFKSKKK